MNVGKAAAEIARLEQALGIESDGMKYLNITKANMRVAQLEQQLAAKGSQAAPAPAPVAAKAPEPPQFSRRQCLDIMRAVFEESPMVFDSLSDADLLADTLARCQAARLSLSGEPPADCSALGNHARIFHGQRQDRLNQVLRQPAAAKVSAPARAEKAQPPLEEQPAPAVPTAAKRETGLVGMARIRAAAQADLDAAGYVPKH
jgi:hypothetical protein